MQKTKLKICLGDRQLFDQEHLHYAKGYCFREYRKTRYQRRATMRPIACAGKNHVGANIFGPQLRHYANGLCRSCYNKARYVPAPKRYFCKTHNRPNFFPDEPAPKVLIQNGICQACSKILDLRKTI